MVKSAVNRLTLKSGLIAVSRKVEVFTSGRSRTRKSCQIANIRTIYDKLGLRPNCGTFVEVGGFDGESYSNTSFLADQGWRGLYVEPVPDFCTRIRFRHFLNNVAVESSAIAQNEGHIDINLMGALSTTSSDPLTAYREIPWASDAARSSQTLRVSSKRLDNVLRNHKIPDRFELMVIDVEGGERPVVESLLESDWRPRALIIELCDRHLSFDGSPKLQADHRLLRRNVCGAGYQEVYVVEINTVFCLK